MNEQVICPKCQGDGKVWADGRKHYPFAHVPTKDCPECNGTGKVPVPSTPASEKYYWWCPTCKEEVDPSRVTFQECHDVCGTHVEALPVTPASVPLSPDELLLTDEEIEKIPYIKILLSRNEQMVKQFIGDEKGIDEAQKSAECVSTALKTAKDVSKAQLKKITESAIRADQNKKIAKALNDIGLWDSKSRMYQLIAKLQKGEF